MGEASSRDRQVVEDVWPAADVLHSTDPLRAGSMREHVLACTQPSTHQRHTGKCTCMKMEKGTSRPVGFGPRIKGKACNAM